MNLSCSGGGLPESGCLFFKVQGITNTTEGDPESINTGHCNSCTSHLIDKFNDTVPGTLVHTQPEANSTEPNYGSPALTETNGTTTVSVSTMVEPTRNVSIFEVGSTLFYAVIGGGIVVLAFSFIIVCVLIRYSVQWKGKSQTFTTADRLQAQNAIHTQGKVKH